ncbi:MAG: FAS1-like dehydratase domain-containing protein [Dehalogenimonas sp.]
MERIPISELKEKAGYELPPLVFDIENGLVRRFADAVGDVSQRWKNEALPSLIPALGFDRVYEILASSEKVAVLHGATEVEFLKSVKIGDTITMKAVISSARERRTANGITVFVNFSISYNNQDAETVANCRQTALVTQND